MDLWSICSVFTPSVLFVVVNLVIGAIAVISARRHGSAGGRPIARSSSSSSNVLERVRSLGLFRFRSGDLPPIANHDDDDGTTTHQQDDRDDTSRSQEYEIGQGEDQRQQQQQFRRIHSESDSKAKKEEEEEAEESKMMEMKKSVSSMMSWRSGEVAARRLRREASGGEEVDAKADDFINRFKQQLKLQRLDSILRYREMLSNKN